MILRHLPCRLFLLIFLFCMTITEASGQDSLLRSAQWAGLKESLFKRDDILVSFRKEIRKAGSGLKQEADSVSAYSLRLFRALNQQVLLNKPAIDSLVQLNKQTKNFLGRTFVLLENEPAKIKEKILPLLAILEAVENRIHQATREYDQYCMEAGRPDCRFQQEQGEDRAPQIRFY